MNYLIARKARGTFILRIDDTDLERSSGKYVDSIKDSLNWLGLHWCREERQSERFNQYVEAVDKLHGLGRLYEAFEAPNDLKLKRKAKVKAGKPPVYDREAMVLTQEEKEKLRTEMGASVWRFKLDRKRVEWTDGIMGDLSIDAASVSDPVLIRQDGRVLYPLASVVDDIDMGVTDVVRGNDHVTNTAVQIQIFEALGGTVPRFAHHALLTGPKGEALSKRLGSTLPLSLDNLRKDKVVPFALLSMLARIGSSDPVELRNNMDDLTQGFDLSRFGAAPINFDVRRLYALNARYLRNMPVSSVEKELASIGIPDNLAEPFWLAVRDNITTLHCLKEWWAMCQNGADPVIADEDRDFVKTAMTLLPDPPFDVTTWKKWTTAVKAVSGRTGKDLFMTLRKALTGRESGPDMSALMPVLQVVRARN